MSELNGLSLLAYSLASSLNFKASSRASGAESEDTNVPARAPAHRRGAHRLHVSGRPDRPAGCASRSCDGSGARQSGTAASLTYARSEKAAIYIRTREGDTVALKITSRDSLSAKARLDDGNVSELSVAGRSSTKVAVLVHGDLNPDELAAIQDLVDQVGALADKFFSGDVQGAFAAAADLRIDGTELARVGLRLGMHEEAGYAALRSSRGAIVSAPTGRSGAEAATGAPGAPATGDGPAANPDSVSCAPEAPASTTSAPVETTDVPAEAPPAETTDAPAETTDAPAETKNGTAAADNPASSAASVLATIGAFLHDLLEAFAAPAGESGAQSSVSLDLSLKIRIFQSFVLAASAPSGSGDSSGAEPGESSGAAPADAAGSPSPGVLSDTLDALAAQQQPPLDAVA
ncbi:MAG TPA: hypothetical protein VFV10_15090 [Gammaproteobacteria bacterium]|nr:hypothetical protein [Gammaproteobacteria bacterium]